MLLTKKDEILEAMDKETAEASASSIEWLAGTFKDILPLEKQNKEFPVELYGKKNKHSEHRKTKRHLIQK